MVKISYIVEQSWINYNKKIRSLLVSTVFTSKKLAILYIKETQIRWPADSFKIIKYYPDQVIQIFKPKG
jgi:hypothetical protein